MERDFPAAPEGLTPPSVAFWDETVREFVLDRQHLKLLEAALQAWDEMSAARKIVAREGLTFTDRFGQPRPHPAVSMAQKARAQFGRLMRQLDLEGEPDPLYRR